MSFALLADRIFGAGFMLVAAALFAWPPPPRRARAAWSLVIVVGVIYGLALNLQPVNFPNSNFFHYYIGAKYPIPYPDTYRLIHAGQGRPQLGFRDLEHPGEIVRGTLPEQRAYYIDLLRGAHAAFDPLAPLDSLSARAVACGALAAEADSILASRIPAARIAEFRHDAREALTTGQGGRVTIDFGYNGSPFYGLLRHADPMLYLPLGPPAAWAQLAWQLLGVVLLTIFVSGALGYSPEERLATAALVLTCMDFASYAMPGLVFGELWVPVALAAWAMAHRRWEVAGAAIAVAGLLKLFPFLLLLAVLVPLVRSFLPAARGEERSAPRVRALRAGLACAVSALVLAWASVATGRDWAGFLHKIVVEFQSQLNMANNVSGAALLITGGVSDRSPLLPVLGLAALLAVAAMFWAREDERFVPALPRRALVLMAATGWFVRSWLNYYVIVPYLLLPWLARRHRGGVVAALVSMAAVYAIPDYDQPVVANNPWLHVLKLAPFAAIPAWMVWLELRDARWSGTARRVAIAAAVLLALATGEEVWRQGTLLTLELRGSAALDAGEPSEALEPLAALVRMAPGNSAARRKHAIALASLGRLDEALPGFARAVDLAPDDAGAHDDYGRALAMAGRRQEAVRQLEIAHRLAPDDVQAAYELARARLAMGRRAEAIALLLRARELMPGEAAIADLLRQAGAR